MILNRTEWHGQHICETHWEYTRKEKRELQTWKQQLETELQKRTYARRTTWQTSKSKSQWNAEPKIWDIDATQIQTSASTTKWADKQTNNGCNQTH